MIIVIIIDDSFRKIEGAKLKGRKPKYKFTKNGMLSIFKFGANNYEIYAELIAEELGNQMGIDMAHYELAIYNGIRGVLTPLFLNDKEELIISTYSLNDAAQKICEENSINVKLKSNTIPNIVQSACIYDSRLDSEALTYELMKRWVFYGLIMESDKNSTNISFIKNNNKTLRLSPDYDNSTMARMNENIGDFVEGMRHIPIYNYTDQIKCVLKIYENESDNFLPSFKTFCEKYYSHCEKIMHSLNNIDVDAAIESVEYINEIEVPWVVKYWLNKAINTRKYDMKNIYDSNKKLIKK